jgi:hypothetical protein
VIGLRHDVADHQPIAGGVAQEHSVQPDAAPCRTVRLSHRDRRDRLRRVGSVLDAPEDIVDGRGDRCAQSRHVVGIRGLTEARGHRVAQVDEDRLFDRDGPRTQSCDELHSVHCRRARFTALKRAHKTPS